jgi:hypothetical protein
MWAGGGARERSDPALVSGRGKGQPLTDDKIPQHVRQGNMP